MATNWHLFVDVPKLELPARFSDHYFGVKLLAAACLSAFYGWAEEKNLMGERAAFNGANPPTGLEAKRLHECVARPHDENERLELFFKNRMGDPAAAIERPAVHTLFVIDLQTHQHRHDGISFTLPPALERLLFAFARNVGKALPEHAWWEILLALGDDCESDTRQLKLYVSRLRRAIAAQTGIPLKVYKELFRVERGLWAFRISPAELVLRFPSDEVDCNA